MRRFVTASLSVAAFVFSGLMANGAIAQDKKMDKGAPKVAIKVITENDKVRVYEATYAPGAENTSVAASTMRVVRGLKGGTLERRYADGKKEIAEWKVGQVALAPQGTAYTTKNIGKTEIRLYVVQLK